MLKILLRLFTVMIIFAGLYLAYTNTNYSSFENLKNKDNFVIKFQNLPEMILPSKEVTTGYQYELIKFYLNNIGNKNIIMKNTLFDVEVYYSTEICSYCIVVNNEDLLIVTLDISNENPDVETIKSFSDIQFKQDIYKDYDINFIDVSIDELINDVHNNLITNIIITRSTYLFYKKYFPNLKIKSKIGKINLLWSFPNDDNSIRENVNLFLNRDETLSFIKNLRNKYYSKNSISSYIFIGSRLFISDMITKLPNYESIFKTASQKYNIDWKLLAAISYQESKWNNDAVSPTGVRGLMMLTKSTAKMMGVDRLNPDQSIHGGAKYIKSLMNKFLIFNESTKINLALASYNAGPNHINDVLLLAKNNNDNVEDWNILRDYLFKLNQKKFYKKMKYGYARGWEAVQYIENVKQYYDIITFLENKDKDNENNIFKGVPNTL